MALKRVTTPFEVSRNFPSTDDDFQLALSDEVSIYDWEGGDTDLAHQYLAYASELARQASILSSTQSEIIDKGNDHGLTARKSGSFE